MSCDDVLKLSDLETAKKHDNFHTEVITGKSLATGENIDHATNAATGQVQKTLPKAINELGGMGYARVGTFATGATLTTARQTLLWDIADGGDGQEYGWSGVFPPSGKVVPPGSTPNSTGGVGVGAWMSRFDPELRAELAGYGGAQIVGNAIRWFGSIQEMLAATDLNTGQKVCTGASLWEITSSSNDWGLDNNTQYARPLNGVHVDDAGADPLGVFDSGASIMFVVNRYNADTKSRFTIRFSKGTYKLATPIALHGKCSYLNIDFNGASLEATADMDSLVSCPAITGLRFGDVGVGHSQGVVINTALIHINNEANTNKTTRHRFAGINGGLITGAPYLLKCDKMWESEIGRIRVDRDVAGKTGEVICLRSCVNNIVQAGEIGYCNVAWRLSKHPDVTYGNEGITFTGGVTTYAKIPMAIDNGTAIRIQGMVLDFCETSGPTFSNGFDVSMESCWIANTTSSAAGWNGFISLPVCNKVKIIGCTFVNNSTNSANCASLNSPESVFMGNTAKGCEVGYRYPKQVQELLNQYSNSKGGAVYLRGSGITFDGDAGAAANIIFESGKNTNQSNQLLQRITLSATKVNANNLVQIDHFQGTYGDQAFLMIKLNGTQKYKLDLVTGDIEVISVGRGLRLTSPDGAITKTLRLSNSGEIELI